VVRAQGRSASATAADRRAAEEEEPDLEGGGGDQHGHDHHALGARYPAWVPS
jgi:hypothetical protein